jgi:hypothetical protein
MRKCPHAALRSCLSRFSSKHPAPASKEGGGGAAGQSPVAKMREIKKEHSHHSVPSCGAAPRTSNSINDFMCLHTSKLARPSSSTGSQTLRHLGVCARAFGVHTAFVRHACCYGGGAAPAIPLGGGLRHAHHTRASHPPFQHAVKQVLAPAARACCVERDACRSSCAACEAGNKWGRQHGVAAAGPRGRPG